MEFNSIAIGIISAVLGALLAYFLFGGATPKPTAPPTPTRPKPRAYTRKEVATHNKETDFWLILQERNGEKLNVYDLTEYIDQHPGGEVIMNNAGGDASVGFKGPQHPPTVWDLIPEYYIGWIDE